jgi:O-antigen/teichoic acid export membrane protein
MELWRQVLGSSMLLVGSRLLQRCLGFVSLLILARLLTPADFGLIALVSIIVYFFDILSSVGSEQYIVQKQSVNEDDLNTAWTIDVGMKSGLWLILMLSAPALSEFFGRGELEGALQLGGTVLIVNAVRNPGLFLLKQALQYRQIFWLSLLQRLVTFCVVIGIAWVERSYWSIIIGDIVASVVFTVGSYAISPHRPRPCTKCWHEQWFFSGWMLARGLVGYLRSQLDTLFVSKLFAPAQLGQYYLARDVAMLPVHNVLLPAMEPLVAVFRQSRAEPERLQHHLSISLYLISVVVIPTVSFIAVHADTIVALMLGPQWKEAGPILGAMSLLLFYYPYLAVYERMLIALAKVRLLFSLDAASLLIVGIGLLLTRDLELNQIALVRGLLGFATLIIMISACNSLVRLQTSGLFGPLLLVALATMLAISLASIVPRESSHETLEQFVLAGTVFISVYALAMVSIMRIARSPYHDTVLKLLQSRRRGAAPTKRP